ncbi:MAG: hypothetical protein JOZ78_20460 [Chroococcidiopsidaceae cyanobacterium CP_BM_ER_R8_30]|nr:hypothetical protein [Chroococcidiopsidaceae cyanobacterium CP_BM_ER_R8_30]
MKLHQKLAMVTMGAALSLNSAFIQAKQVKAANFTFTQGGYNLTSLSVTGTPIPPTGFPSLSNPYEIVGSFTTSGTTITDANLNILDDVVAYNQKNNVPPSAITISKSGSFDPSTNNLSLNVNTQGFFPPGTVAAATLFLSSTSNNGQFSINFYGGPSTVNGFAGLVQGNSSSPAIVKEVPEPDWVVANALLLVLGTFGLRSSLVQARRLTPASELLMSKESR